MQGRRIGTLFTTQAHGSRSPESIAEIAKQGGRQLEGLTGPQRREIIEALADLLVTKTGDIMIANQRDLEQAELEKIEPAIIDRLRLTDSKIANLASGKADIMI